MIPFRTQAMLAGQEPKLEELLDRPLDATQADSQFRCHGAEGRPGFFLGIGMHGEEGIDGNTMDPKGLPIVFKDGIVHPKPAAIAEVTDFECMGRVARSIIFGHTQMSPMAY